MTLRSKTVSPSGKGVVNEKIKKVGSKGLVFMNRQGQVYEAHRIEINDSDFNILKETGRYAYALKELVLADRGFKSKTVKDRLATHHLSSSIFALGESRTRLGPCRLLRPRNGHPNPKGCHPCLINPLTRSVKSDCMSIDGKLKCSSKPSKITTQTLL